MSKVILNLANVEQQLTKQGVSSFVLDLKHVVGLVKTIHGEVEVTYKVGELPAVKVYVTNDFEDLAYQLIAFNPDFFVVTTEEKVKYIAPIIVPGGLSYTTGEAFARKQFLVNSKRVIGVANVNGKTELTLKAPEGSERKVFYVNVDGVEKELAETYVHEQMQRVKQLNVIAKTFGCEPYPTSWVNAIQEKVVKQAPVKFVVEEDFDVIASLVVYGSFDPELD